MTTTANLVHQSATTTGTSDFTLSAINGKQSFNTAFGNGVTTNVFYYFISNRGAAEWEVGTGHMSDATTLVRDTVIASTNSNNAVNFSAGQKDVTNDLPAERALTIGRHTIYIPASAMLKATTSGPALAQLESSSNKINFGVLDFDASADEHAHFQIPPPKSWDRGVIQFQIFWTTSATDTDGVAWGLQAVAVSDNEAIDAAFGTPIVVTDDAQGAANEMLVSAISGDLTVGGSPADADMVFFRVFRDVSDGNDDMTEDARLIGIKLFITLNAPTDA